jgi:arylsulfatase A-like enzyme
MADLTRRTFLGTVGAGAAALGAAAERRRPNIVYVFADQHRQCSWGGGGDPQVRTPNLDLLARQGVAFNHCISNYPLCSPYRASLLTGRYPQTNGVTGNIGGGPEGLSTREVTIAGLLKKAGYASGYVGKWHLYPGAAGKWVVPPGPHRHGFDYWRVCQNYRERYNTSYFDDAGKSVVIRDYAPKGQMDMTLDFIERNASRPFCIMLSYHPPHAPYTEAPQRFADMYPAPSLKLRPNVPKEADARWRQAYAGYFASVSALDDETGRLMKKLDQLGIADNTIVCYSSDHGDMLGSQDMAAKNKPWEESINVPFVVRWPAGIPAGRRLDTLFSTVDISPTLLGLAGVPALAAMQGADLSPILRGGNASGPESAFIMSIGRSADEGEEVRKKRKAKAAKRGNFGGWRGVRTARYTYAARMERAGLSPWLLYDNRDDPFQTRNLIGDAAHTQTRKDLEEKLRQWRRLVQES